MNCCKIQNIDRKKLWQMLGLTALCTFVSVTLSIIVTMIVNSFIVKKANLKQTLQELFPEYDWEFTGIYQSMRRVVFTIYFQPGFVEDYPDAEARLRDALIQRSPGLADMRMEIVFRHREEFNAG